MFENQTYVYKDSTTNNLSVECCRISERIKTRRSDEEFPWPPGKDPWSTERGGTGIAPDNARENWGKDSRRSADRPRTPSPPAASGG